MPGKRSRLPVDLDHTNAYTDDSDSSDNSDYDENEMILLSKVKRKRKDDSEGEDEALFDVESEEDSDNKSDLALSDVEEDEADNLPNVKAWGKDKRSYYSTDYVDQDYGGHAGRDALNADFEEVEAQNLQLQLAMQLEDEDFLLFDAVPKKSDFTKLKTIDEVVKPDVSNLTKRQQIQLLVKESPEFLNLVNDFKEKMVLVKDVLLPASELYEKGHIPKSNALNFLLIYQDLLLNYCTNITMYFLLKSHRAKLQSHPVINRLLQYRQLINKMEPIYDKYVAEKLIALINNYKINREERKLKEIVLKKPKKSKKLETNTEKKLSKVVDNKETKDLLTAFDKQVAETIAKEDAEENEAENEIDDKRAITYQMKKNKGLMPTRKKEQRNPRVKHRNKFRKAQIRRKGAVREVRTEINRYGGEISGIKASVAKGIKIK